MGNKFRAFCQTAVDYIYCEQTYINVYSTAAKTFLFRQ